MKMQVRHWLALLAVVCVAGVAAVGAEASTQYGFLDNSVHGAQYNPASSVSYVLRANPAAGNGSVVYGFIYNSFAYSASCGSLGTCSKQAGTDFGIPPTVLFCNQNSFNAFWSCRR